jgi:hypothetical protein
MLMPIKQCSNTLLRLLLVLTDPPVD